MWTRQRFTIEGPGTIVSAVARETAPLRRALAVLARLLGGLAAVAALTGATPALPDCAPHPSPAEASIELARRAIEKSPGSPRPHNDLALAYARRARETADPTFYDRAQEALRRSFELEPENLGGRKVLVWVLLGKHEFQQALEAASALWRLAPDDLWVSGLLVDAHVELGNYEEAERAAQWMLDLRPGNVPGLTRAAYLRELFGDLDGAREFMHAAYARTRPAEIEDRAWLLTQVGHLHRLAGDPGLAAGALANALQIFPDYHYALAELARVRADEGRHAEAAALRERHVQIAPHPENRFHLGQELQRAGRVEEAARAFAAFEAEAIREQDRADNANRELVFYYADHAGRPAEALRVARHEAARRHDVHTLDALAWALFVNGEVEAAREQMNAVLAVGLRDPEVLARARQIGLRERPEEP
jgi:tetratricopeptide (TPR) repeat protein